MLLKVSQILFRRRSIAPAGMALVLYGHEAMLDTEVYAPPVLELTFSSNLLPSFSCWDVLGRVAGESTDQRTDEKQCDDIFCPYR